MRIRLDDAGKVIVTVPWYALPPMVNHFVEQSRPWIERQQQRIKLKKDANPILNWEAGLVSYLGKLYTIKFATSGDKVVFDAGVCWVHPITNAEADIKKTLFAWLQRTAEQDILLRTKSWAEKIQVRFGTVRFGQQSSRWGSCTADNNLRFNWRLIHFPPDVIDYVVIHELSHTVHHDHSDRFWELVSRYSPGWKTHRSFLKRQAVVIEK
jgi:predicted metal-dependent hydrolase